MVLGNPTSDGSAANFVFASVSSNGGASFDSTVIVNDSGCGVSGSPREVDQPNAVFDYTTEPPTLWVVFRSFTFGIRSSDVGACIRRGIVEKGGSGVASIRWLDPAHSVDGMGGSGFDAFPYTYGLGVAAGDGVVTVMYNVGTSVMPSPNNKNAHNDPCPDDNPDANGMAWATVDSFDNGHTWVDNSKIFHTESSQWCVLGESPNTRGGSLPTVGHVLMGLRSFALARAPGGILYAILQDTRHSARLFMSPAGGTKGWASATSTIRTWYEWCPGTPTSNVPGGPTWNWKTTGVDNPDQPPCATAAIDKDPGADSDGGLVATGLDLVWPNLAVDGRGNLALTTVEDLRGGSSPIINYAVRGITNPQADGAFIQPPAFVQSGGFSLPGNGFTRPLGDYTWIAVRPRGASFRAPGCTTTNDFFPLWTADDGSNNPRIIVRGFSVTPP